MSVVIPNHNYAKYVPVAIESVLAQTYEPTEVIVVDNGSTDDSLAVLERYADRCTIVTQRDLGQSGARNRGILESRGDLIAFLDADDAWRPDKLARQVPLFISDPELGLAYCSLELADEDLRPTGTVMQARFRGDALEHFARWPGRAIVVGGESTAVVSRVAIASAGMFDPGLSIAGGWDLWRRIATRRRIDYVADPLVFYRQHATNLHRALDTYERDDRRAGRSMFEDPAAARVFAARRRFDAGMDLMFAKARARSGDLPRAAFLLARAVARDPRQLASLKRSEAP